MSKQAMLWFFGATGESPGARLERLTFDRRLYAAAIAILGVNTFVALWIGLQDLFTPAGLPAQAVGISYVAAGLLSLYGVFNTFLGARIALPLNVAGMSDDRVHALAASLQSAARQIFSFIAAAAIAGLYIDVTIVFYSFHYRLYITLIFAVLALLCACIARVTLPVFWSALGRGLKVTGLSLAALGLVAQFWYQSIYVPGNTPSGINYTVALGPKEKSGGHTWVQVNVGAEDTGSVPALALASMIIVRGVTPGVVQSPVLAVYPLVNVASFFFPGETASHEFLVKLANQNIKALRVSLYVAFARTTWLTLGKKASVQSTCYDERNKVKSCKGKPALSCPETTKYVWDAVESNLRTFTQGPEVAHSTWICAKGKIAIDAGILPNHTPPGSDLGILYSSRVETLALR